MFVIRGEVVCFLYTQLIYFYRDKYKRVSLRLGARELELESKDRELARKERELARIEGEYKELEEFARLEEEVGLKEDRRLSRSSTNSLEDQEQRVKVLERNFSDAESMSLELNKELRITKQQLDTITQR